MSTTMTRPDRTADARNPGPTYAGIPFSRLLRVEWGKATDTRAARWLLAAVATLTVGLMLAPLLAATHIDQTYTSYLGFAAFALSTLLPVVAILTLTSEWSQRTVLTTFTQEPRRMRVMNAKILVALLLGVAAAVFGGLVTAAGLGVAAASGRELESNMSASLVIGYLLYVLLNVFMGVALGALIHNSAGAIVASFVLPIGLSMIGGASRWVSDWLAPTTALDWVLNAEWSGHTTKIVLSLTLWVAIPLSLGLVRTVRREIH